MGARTIAVTPAAATHTGQLSPLLAICALCGGAGASTLAYLVARSATHRWDRPILLCDAGGPTGGLAMYARVQAPRSLIGLANLLAAHEAPGEGLYADGGDGLRVLAGAPDLVEEADPGGLERLVSDAREAHDLIVVDCGTLRGRLERQVMQTASHVAWVLPATLSGVRRGRRTLDLFPLDASRHEVVIARGDGSRRTLPAEELSALATARMARLVLMPQVPDLGEYEPERALDEAAVALEAIWTVIRR